MAKAKTKKEILEETSYEMVGNLRKVIKFDNGVRADLLKLAQDIVILVQNGATVQEISDILVDKEKTRMKNIREGSLKTRVTELKKRLKPQHDRILARRKKAATTAAKKKVVRKKIPILPPTIRSDKTIIMKLVKLQNKLPGWELGFLDSMECWCLDKKLMSKSQRTTALRIIKQFS